VKQPSAVSSQLSVKASDPSLKAMGKLFSVILLDSKKCPAKCQLLSAKRLAES